MPNINNISMNQQRNQRIGHLESQKHQHTSAQRRICINAVRRTNASARTNPPLSLGATFTSVMAVMTAGVVLGSVLQTASASPTVGNEDNQSKNQCEALTPYSASANATMPRSLQTTPDARGFVMPAVKEPIGGKQAKKGLKAYAVYIEPQMIESVKQGKGTCTGSALTEDTILTAAHCVFGLERGPIECKINGKVVNKPGLAEFFARRFGTEDPSAKDDSDSKDVDVKNTDVKDADVKDSGAEDSSELLGVMKCTHSYERRYRLPAEKVVVKYGTELSKLNDNIYQAERIIAHPSFTNGVAGLDLALIKLKEPIKGIPLLRLPTDQINTQLGEQIKANVNRRAIVHENNVYIQGWGVIPNPNATESWIYDPENPSLIPTNQLKEGQLTTVNYIGNAECKIALCTVSKNSSTCPGDSGGPIIFFDSSSAEPYVVGVYSLGIGVSGCSDFASMHANVFRQKKWIEGAMREFDSGLKFTPKVKPEEAMIMDSLETSSCSPVFCSPEGEPEYVRLMLDALAKCPKEIKT